MRASTTLWARDLLFARWAASQIGDLITAAYAPDAVRKPDGTPQTQVDRDGNARIHHLVRRHQPADLVLGEEDVTEMRTPPPGARVWVCDPVDGTWLLAGGMPYTVVSLALVVDGQPTVAVVVDPHTRRTFTATAGGGAECNARPLHVNHVDALHGSVLMLPGGRVPPFDAAGLLAEVVRFRAEVLTVGSAVHDATFVPSGFAAGYIYPYTSPWDMAAVALLTTEAGGRCTALDGTAQRYDDNVRGAILSNGLIHDELVDLVGRWSH